MNNRGGACLFVVWLDYSRARVFQFSDERMERHVYSAPDHPDHHTHRKEGDEKESPDFFDLVASKLEFARRIVILGPGVAHVRFFHRLQEKHPRIAKRVVGCEVSDHPTDNQIAAYAIKYFQKPVAS